MAPKVFVSHASEDKDRFVLQFAKRLLANGIDAWVDKWEMLPGDSIVDKIFEEGIKEAKAVIVVLSKFSVEKQWVKEELNAAFVKRINNGSKLIPVVIDDCEIPEALKSTLWERITDLTSYESSLDRIVAAIFGATDKPAIGSPPQYVHSFVQSIDGLNNMDSLVLHLSCEEILKTNNPFVHPGKVFLENGLPVIPEEELKDSLEILDGQGYIKLVQVIGRGFSPYQITVYGFDKFVTATVPDYQEKVAAVVSAIVNENLRSNTAIREKLNEQVMIINHILAILENNGHIKVTKMVGGLIQIYNVSPSLKRALRGG